MGGACCQTHTLRCEPYLTVRRLESPCGCMHLSVLAGFTQGLHRQADESHMYTETPLRNAPARVTSGWVRILYRHHFQYMHTPLFESSAAYIYTVHCTREGGILRNAHSPIQGTVGSSSCFFSFVKWSLAAHATGRCCQIAMTVFICDESGIVAGW